MSTAAAGSYEGGIGGKFRRRPFKRAPTPYDRPPTAHRGLRNPIESNRNGWFSKLVDPASRIITTTATRFFSSVFPKRLPAPPPLLEGIPEHRNEFSEVVCNNPSAGAQEQNCNEGDCPSNSSDSTGINDLEQLLKRKTFTKDEFDRLTELLRSRTLDLSTDYGEKKTEACTSLSEGTRGKPECANISVQEDGLGSHRLFGGISTPAACLSMPEEVASPAELAKAFMGTRPSKISPSTLGLRGQTFREDTSWPCNIPSTPKSPNMSLAPRSSVRFSGVLALSENGYQIRTPRGRSAIYNMARSPYSRVYSPATQKGTGLTGDSYTGPSTSSQWTPGNNTLSGGKQVLKRRSSVLENDIGSVGPIRRIRQKSNLLSPSKDINLAVALSPSPTTLNGSKAIQSFSTSNRKPFQLDEAKHNISDVHAAENGNNKIYSAAVPPQSSDMARKILQQLDKMVPSPKERSSELKLAIAREKSPAKLTRNMLHGQALRSMEDVDSPTFHKVQGPGALDGIGDSHLIVNGSYISQKQDKAEENGPMKNADARVKLVSDGNSMENAISAPTIMTSGTSAADSILSDFAANPPRNKRAFQMSAPEDSLELEDDCCDIDSFALASEKLKPKPSGLDPKSAKVEAVEKPLVPSSNSKSVPSFISDKGDDMRASNGPTITEKDTGFTFSVTPASTTLSQPPPTPTVQPSTVYNKFAEKQDKTAAPVFGFSTKSVDQDPVFTFSSTSTSNNVSSGFNFGESFNSKSENLSSNATETVRTLATPPEVTASDNGHKTQKASNLLSSLQNADTSVPSTSPAPNIFSFGGSTGPSLGNGSLTSAAPLFSSSLSMPTSGSSSSLICSSSNPSITSSASTFPEAPKLQFGSSISAASTTPISVAQPSATSGFEAVDSEPRKKPPSSDTTATSLPASSPLFTTTGSSIFGFSASATPKTINSSSAYTQSSSPFGIASGSFGTQETSTRPESALFTHSAPSQFGSSVSSSPVSGFSGSSTFGSGSSLFGSSAPGSGFGLSSSTSAGSCAAFSSSGTSSLFGASSQSATTSIFDSGSSSQSATASIFGSGSSSQSATASIFGSGSSSQPAASSIFGTGFGSTTSLTGFSFGGSSATASATPGSVPFAFGSSQSASTGSLFPFTSSSSTMSRPVFGISNAATGFGSGSPGNDQMSVEDSMAEDTVQASMPVVPAFGQPTNSPAPANFMFASPNIPSGGTSVFQFGGQQNLSTPQSQSPFSAGTSSQLPGGSFSLGSGGGDKANRKIVRVRRDKIHRKK